MDYLFSQPLIIIEEILYFFVPFSKDNGVPRDLLVDGSLIQYFKHLRTIDSSDSLRPEYYTIRLYWCFICIFFLQVDSSKSDLNSELFLRGIWKMAKGSVDYHETSLEFQLRFCCYCFDSFNEVIIFFCSDFLRQNRSLLIREIDFSITDVKYKSNLRYDMFSTIDEILDRAYMSVISFTWFRKKNLHEVK